MTWMSDEYRHPLSWKNRGTRAVLGLVALVLVVRLGWGWYIGRALAAELRLVRAQGWPVEVSDLAIEWVEDSQNAAILLQKAGAAHVNRIDSPRNSSLEYTGYPPYGRPWLQLAEASEKAHGQVFALARQARALPRSQFQRAQTSPLFARPFGYLNPLRQTANTLGDGAEWSHQNGDDAEAVERLLDALHIGHCLRQDDTVVSQLVAAGIDALACYAAQAIAPGLRVEPAPTTRPATRQQVQALIARLLDEDLPRRGMVQSFHFERVGGLELFEFQARGTWIIHPLARKAMEVTSRNNRIYHAASSLPNWPQARELVRNCQRIEPAAAPRWTMFGPPPPLTVPRYSRWFHAFSNDLSGYFELHYRVIAERRVTALSFAAQLYRVDTGRWPDRLDELVPRYLPALPADPFHADGRPIGYAILKGGLPDGGDRPVLYFDAGPDVSGNPPAEPCYGWYNDPSQPRRDPIRQYRDLTRFVPPKPSTTKAVDDDPEKPDAGGQQAEEDKGAQQPEQQ